MKKRSKTVHGESEGDMQMKTLPHESGAKKQTKRKSNEREEKKQMKTVTRESKIFSRRKSLAGYTHRLAKETKLYYSYALKLF